jgi:hypothetical protein
VTARPAPPPASWLRRIRIEGYRSFGAPLDLDGLGRVVVLYGLNNAGKTNLLRAVELLGRLAEQELVRFLDDTPQALDPFLVRMGQDAWMFAQGQPPVVRIEAELGPSGDAVGFEIRRDGDRVYSRLTRWTEGGDDAAAEAFAARREFLDGVEHTFSPEDEERIRMDKAAVRWNAFGASLGAARTDGWLPVSPERRAAFVQLGRSPEVARRGRMRRASETFGKIVHGLAPGGRLEDVQLPGLTYPGTRDDLAWVTDDVLLPLDQLGSGAQAIFGLLASLALAEAPIVLVDEPEQHLNVAQQAAVLGALTASLEGLGLGQLFLATHSVKFARTDLDLRRLDRDEQGAHARRVTPPELGAYEVRGPAAPREKEVSMLADDGSIEVPDYVREALGLRAGEFVYFVRDGKGGYRVVSTAAMRAALGDE